MNKKLLFRLVALVAAMMCALDASAAEVESYACYTPSNTTLTFYYDNLRSTRPGTTFDISGSGYPAWVIGTSRINDQVTNAVFDASFADARPTTTEMWFCDMINLTTITGIEYFNTSRVTSMMLLFSNCKKLTSIDVSGFKTSIVTNMTAMFNGCSGLTTLDLSSFNTARVDYWMQMFTNCSNLRSIYVGNNWTVKDLTSGNIMFDGCINLVGGQGTTYDANHTDATYAHIDGGISNPGYLTDINATLEPEAYACFTESNTTLTFYYDNLRSTRQGTTYDLNTGTNQPGWYSDGIYQSVTNVVFNSTFANARPTSCFYWFRGMSNLASFTGLNYLNTSEVTNMNSMFYKCSKLTSLDLSSLNTAKVTNMQYMFYICSQLTTLDLSSFNTAKVTNMNTMFYSCENLTTIYAGSGWNTDAVTSHSSMFTQCTWLVGGQGTTYDANHTNKAYAHIDGGPSNPGYFTAEGAQPWAEPVAYACYTADNTTLTFYYDNLRSTRPGTIYALNDADHNPGWRSDNTCLSVTEVVFNPSFAGARPTSTRMWFGQMENLMSITGISYLNTEDVTYMGSMFSNCSKLTSLDLSGFNTAKVTNMQYMFNNCSQLTSLNVSSFNTANVTIMMYMFNGCSQLTSIDVSSFNTANATSMIYMFYGCTGLTSLDVSNFNTSNVTSMKYMFAYCSDLTSLDLSSFNTAKVTIMENMFRGSNKLTTIYAGNEWTTDAVTSSATMFNNCTKLVGGMGTAYNADHVDAAYAHIDGGPSYPGYFTAKPSEAYACYTPSNTTLTFYYDNLRSTRTGTTFDLNEGHNDPSWYSYHNRVTEVEFDPSFADARPTSTCSWFYEMSNLTSITGLEYLNTSEVTDMCCMFALCQQLPSLDLSHFNTANVTDMYGMFAFCQQLTSLDLSHFNTANVADMRHMFHECSSLTSLDLSSFNTANVTNMFCMFVSCFELTTLDLSSFNTANVKNMVYTFEFCNSLSTIYVGDGWNTERVTSSEDMFTDCFNLVGGKGTTYDANHVDKTYAHIDGGPSNPGYFTEKVDYVRGDVNGDGNIGMDDLTALINYLVYGTAVDMTGADANLSGDVGMDDLTALINYLVYGHF